MISKNVVDKSERSGYVSKKIYNSSLPYVVFLFFIIFQSVHPAQGNKYKLISGDLAERFRWILLSDNILERSKVDELNRLHEQGYLLSFFYTKVSRGYFRRGSGCYKEVPLSLAVYNGEREVVQCLLDRGVKVNQYDGSRRTALDYAACIGDPFMINLLINQGAKKERTDSRGSSALFRYIQCGHNDSKVLSLLCSDGVNRLGIHTRQERWFQRFATPLSLACFYGNSSAVDTLLKMGASTEGICREENKNRVVTILSANQIVKKGKIFFDKLLRADVDDEYYKKKTVEYAAILKRFEAIEEEGCKALVALQ